MHAQSSWRANAPYPGRPGADMAAAGAARTLALGLRLSAAYLVFASMVMDCLDGMHARRTKQVCDLHARVRSFSCCAPRASPRPAAVQ